MGSGSASSIVHMLSRDDNYIMPLLVHASVPCTCTQITCVHYQPFFTPKKINNVVSVENKMHSKLQNNQNPPGPCEDKRDTKVMFQANSN
jgi:hypothetical protein